jgi:amidase
MIDLDTSSATDALAALAAGTISSRELLEAQVERIERDNPALNAVVAFDLDRARAQAAAADDERAAGRPGGPLHGLPMTIKDAFETEGLVTASGAPELADHVPSVDADAVARLKRAGAIVFAKTNVPLYAGDMQTDNLVYGRTSNPWDLTRSPGGSSGGAAAALATGMTLLELGSDIGGSIRNPAHYCGVFGHKPTYALVPERGHVPPAPGSLGRPDLGVMGPLGRSVADLRLGLDILAVDQFGRGGAAARPEAPSNLQGLRDLRVGLWLDDEAAPTDAPVLERLEAAARAVEQAGATVVDGARTAASLEEQHVIYLNLLAAAVGAGFPEEVRELLSAQAAELPPASPTRGTAMLRGMTQSHAAWVAVDEQRAGIARQWAEVFGQVDVMLTPVSPVAAIAHDMDRPMDERVVEVNGTVQPYMCQLVWAGLATLPGLPATVVPVGAATSGASAGLPVGLQIVGGFGRDSTTLAAAGWIEELLGGFVAPPPR